MKKLIVKILTAVLSAVVIFGGLIACGFSSNDWKNPTMTDWGEGSVYGGFLGEKGNYLYFINGQASSSDDNSFGAPVKGALMVKDKTDLSKEAQVVVPKLFVANDFKAGVYIYGDYAYYGTPNTDKDSSGGVANYEMTFARTKLDGTDTTSFFTMDTLDEEYRFVEVGGDVYLVYYNTDDETVYSYNTTTGENTVVIKKDAKVAGAGAESLEKFSLSSKDGLAQNIVMTYSVTIYRQDYYEEVSNRPVESFNKVYAYGVFDGELKSVEIVNGKQGEFTYTLNMVNGKYAYMTKKDIYQNETTVRVDILTKEEKEIKKADSITDKSLFVGDSVIITNDTGVIMVNPFVKDGADSEIIAVPGNVNAMLYYDDKGDADNTNDYLYYYNGANQLCRINVRNENAVEERVSEDTVTTTWYNPEFIMIGNDLYAFYLDNSTKGESNIKYVNLSVGATGEDTDDDGKNDKFYLENQAFLGKVIDKDQAKMVDSVISEVQADIVDGVMQFEEENGVLTLKSYEKAQELYDAQTDAVKDLVSSSNVKHLETYAKAIEMANLYNKLAEIKNYKKLSETEKQALEQVYTEVKAEIETFIASEDYTEISGLLGSDLNAYYQNAKKEFDKTAE